MALFKTTQFFRVNQAGWSESWYLDTTNLDNAHRIDGILAFHRKALLGNAAVYIGNRVASVENPGQSRAEIINSPRNSLFPADIGGVAINVRVTTTDGSRRMFQMRGAPDSVFQNGLYVGGSGITTAFEQWRDEMINRQYRLLNIDKSHPVLSVASVSATGEVTLSEPHTLVIGHRVQFLRTRTNAGQLIQGLYVVTAAPDNTHFTVFPWPAGGVTGGGSVRRFVMTTTQIVNMIDQNATFRKPGRPFGSPRGRRSKSVNTFNSALTVPPPTS